MTVVEDNITAYKFLLPLIKTKETRDLVLLSLKKTKRKLINQIEEIERLIKQVEQLEVE